MIVCACASSRAVIKAQTCVITASIMSCKLWAMDLEVCNDCTAVRAGCMPAMSKPYAQMHTTSALCMPAMSKSTVQMHTNRALCMPAMSKLSAQMHTTRASCMHAMNEPTVQMHTTDSLCMVHVPAPTMLCLLTRSSYAYMA
eukprot:1158308-Pelagomonas_calceolata.AAC.9